jgi:hypothetical protein
VKPLRFIFSTALVVLTSLTLIKIIQSSDARSRSNLSEIEFFKGTWECRLKDSNKVFSWTVTKGLKNSWLVGVVQAGQEKVSNDYWRSVNGKIERFAFTGEGLFIKIDSSGWESGKLVFSGSANQPTEEFKVRETITQNSDREFHAVWEKMRKNQQWSTSSDEICTKS